MIDMTRPLGERMFHLCIDMQRLFSMEGPWPTPWMERVLPVAERIVAHAPAHTIFTRFVPPPTPEAMPGTWRRYYRKWAAVTRERLHPDMIELLPALAARVPPAVVLDKAVYSAFADGRLTRLLHARGAEGVIVTGAETDVCVLASVLGAVDHGYRVVIATDAVCSGSDQQHDNALALYARRYSEQVETADSETILMLWRPVG